MMVEPTTSTATTATTAPALTATVDDENGHIRPLLVALPEAGRILGGIKKTALYNLLRREKVALVKIGGRSVVALADLERVANEQLKAAKSARRFRRGDAQMP